MKSRIEQIKTSKNKINSFYFKCINCDKVIPPLLGYISSNDNLNNFCTCKNPIIDDIIYIDRIK